MAVRQYHYLFNLHFITRTNYELGIPFSRLKLLFAKTQSGSENDRQSRSSRKGARIMVVDDEQDISTTFKLGLERKGFSVDVFNNPLQALAHFKPGYYDILLLDIRMPDMNGFELCEQIRKQDKNTKVLFVSAFEVHEDELKKCLPQANLKCVVKKPILISELAEIIDKALSEKSE